MVFFFFFFLGHQFSKFPQQWDSEFCCKWKQHKTVHPCTFSRGPVGVVDETLLLTVCWTSFKFTGTFSNGEQTVHAVKGKVQSIAEHSRHKYLYLCLMFSLLLFPLPPAVFISFHHFTILNPLLRHYQSTIARGISQHYDILNCLTAIAHSKHCA